MFSVIYTPTEGDAIQNYSRLFRKPEGCFLNIRDQDSIEECLSAFGNDEDVDYIVVSDGEEVHASKKKQHMERRLSFLIDSWYWRSGRGRHSHICRETGHYHSVRWNPSITPATSCSGLRNKCNIIPCLLRSKNFWLRRTDVSQNEDLLNDELYLGLRERRVRGKEYDEFVDKFVQIARKRFPNAYIHL